MRANSNVSNLMMIDIITSDNTSLSYNFATQPKIEGREIQRIAVRKNDTFCATGQQVLDTIGKGFLEIHSGSKIIFEAPLSVLFIDSSSPTFDTLAVLSLKNVDWQKSRVYFPNGTSMIANKAISFVIDYV